MVISDYGTPKGISTHGLIGGGPQYRREMNRTLSSEAGYELWRLEINKAYRTIISPYLMRNHGHQIVQCQPRLPAAFRGYDGVAQVEVLDGKRHDRLVFLFVENRPMEALHVQHQIAGQSRDAKHPSAQLDVVLRGSCVELGEKLLEGNLGDDGALQGVLVERHGGKV